MEDHLQEDVPAPEQPPPGAAFTDATNEEESDQNSTSPDDEEVATPGGHTNTITKHLMGGIISGELLSITTTSSVTVMRVAEKDEEEKIELELLRAMYNDHAHNLYCPNCNGQITMVILRRDKGINNAPTTTTTPPPLPLPLPLPLPRDKGINNAPPPPPPPPPPPRRDKVINYVPTRTPPPPLPPHTDKRTLPLHTDKRININNAPTRHKDNMINNAPTSPTSPPTPPPPPPQWLLTSLFRYLPGFVISGTHKITGIDHTTILEILKCIVYGGLIESITSLNVVCSVAASDATTLNVLATGFAILFSGLIAFGYNLVDLNDIHSEKKYEELLGSKEHFLFHSTFAILSYLVFGLVAPITYGFAFRESDNRDYKIIAVVAAAFACIFILAIAKAYVGEADKLGYIKTTRYYLIMALSVSGVGYAVGNLIEMIMLKLGLFKSAQ